MEEEFTIQSTDFSRPDLKQIQNSLFEIKCHFVQNNEFSVIPTTFESPLQEIKNSLLQRLEDDECLLHGDNIVTHVTDCITGKGITRGFSFLCVSLPVVFNFTARPRPANVRCDLFLHLPNQPCMIFTITEGDKSQRDVIVYNTSVHRGITTSITRFLDTSFKTVFGVLSQDDIKDTASFNACVQRAAALSSTFVSSDSLSMSLQKYEKVLTAFWASVAETTAVLPGEKEKNKEFLHFLTKEQCIILVENINKRDVHITVRRGTGATTLMLEVARRLSRIGDTLLVVKNAEDVGRLRSFHANIVTKEELSPSKVSKYKNVIDETNSFKSSEQNRLWAFRTDETHQEEEVALQQKILELKKMNEMREGRITELVKEKEMLKRHLSFIQTGGTLLELKQNLNHQTYENGTEQSRESRGATLTGATPIPHKEDSKHLSERIRRLEQIYRQNQTQSDSLEANIAAVPYNASVTTVGVVRDFEYGSGRQSDILDLLRNMILHDNQNLKELQCQKKYLEEVIGSPVITLGIKCRPVHVICADVQFDKLHVNTEYCQVTKDNILTNSPPESQNNNPQRLKVYLGTIANITFPPAQPRPDPVLHAPHYWESHNRIWLNRKLGKWLTLLDIGVCEERQVDKAVWACNQSNSWAFRILGCNIHHPWICAQIFSDGKRVDCVRDVMENSAGSSARLKFGIVVDPGSKKVAFIDLNGMSVIHKFDVTFGEKVYPAFGVGPWRNEYTVDMSLVAGKNIIWSDVKKDLIHSALK